MHGDNGGAVCTACLHVHGGDNGTKHGDGPLGRESLSTSRDRDVIFPMRRTAGRLAT
jgi:hypothetical protein